MRYSNAHRPAKGGKPYHITIRPGALASYVILPGSPERAESISKLWQCRRFLAGKREFLTHAGTCRGVDLAVTSLGIGSPAASIAIEELASIGAKTLLRVGSTGSIQNDIHVGDLIINVACVRYDGITAELMKKRNLTDEDIGRTHANLE